ncbi:MAG: putative small integral membrane protein [Pseudohongiellaceae bacterium]|jgi:predicted small integral membrane protein
MDLSWMAWTQPTAIFFAVIAGLILLMSVWEFFSPGGSPRVGVLRFETTRGDRLFITLLGSAFINLAWLGLAAASLWWGLALCLVFGLAVFLFV